MPTLRTSSGESSPISTSPASSGISHNAPANGRGRAEPGSVSNKKNPPRHAAAGGIKKGSPSYEPMMTKPQQPNEVGSALGACKRYFVTALLFSLAINLLYLAGPLYMLQVY